ncbi:hypothetical protein [Planosporangium thailandense]|uniref:hypothetical protein n=1 Tax=Planosporangium thailandense TaxID=765197 RepID=UPI001F106E2E|nr:hypothetical protein [Planosporangium thailandense]
MAEAFDHTVAPAYRWSPDRVADLLRGTGLVEVARLVIAASEDSRRGFQQAHLLVRKPVGGATDPQGATDQQAVVTDQRVCDRIGQP